MREKAVQRRHDDDTVHQPLPAPPPRACHDPTLTARALAAPLGGSAGKQPNRPLVAASAVPI